MGRHVCTIIPHYNVCCWDLGVINFSYHCVDYFWIDFLHILADFYGVFEGQLWGLVQSTARLSDFRIFRFYLLNISTQIK